MVAGRAARAEERFRKALDHAGPLDRADAARARLFRGALRWRLGRREEAEADIAEARKAEGKGVNRLLSAVRLSLRAGEAEAFGERK
jgi:tetratricopeptide (TPR) repeat protein